MRERHRIGRAPLPDPDVQMVQRAGFDLNQDFIRSDHRIRNIFVDQLLRPTVLLENDGLHFFTLPSRPKF